MLESVKILPPTGTNDPDLYGAVTAQATALPETQAPARRRVFSMAVTAPADRQQGEPTSWSAAVDALAAGRSFDAATKGLVYLDQAEQNAHRLFVIAAGNVDEGQLAQPTCSSPTPRPCTILRTRGTRSRSRSLRRPRLTTLTTMARLLQPGDLSPWSSTGVTLSTTWPNKPDVASREAMSRRMARASTAARGSCLLSTFHRPVEKLFVLSNASSAATAQVARLAAIVSAEYPALWRRRFGRWLSTRRSGHRSCVPQSTDAGNKKVFI